MPSEVARRLLASIRRDGRASNITPLITAMGVSDGEFETAKRELLDAGVIREVGRGRLARVQIEPPSEGLSEDAVAIYRNLPTDGSFVGNIRLRSRVDLDNEAYAEARRELLDAGLIQLGRGRGGSVARVSEEPGAEAESPTLVRRESDLYQPFTDWLQSSFDPNLAFAHADITATPARRRRRSGRWSRPDVTSVEVARLEWLPVVDVTVSTFEIKPAAAANAIESVYEAAAHGKQAHKASLVIERAPGSEAISEEVQSTARRFGLGLYVISLPPGGRIEVDDLLEPELQTPEPALVERLLEHLLSRDQGLVTRYRMAIG